MTFTAFQVQRVCHYAPTPRIFSILLPLNESLVAADAATPLRASMYLANWAHETCEFRYLEEISDGSHYDIQVNPRLARKLGNIEPGDGVRFKGRGFPMLTGRYNYAHLSADLGVDFIAQPGLLATPKYGALAAARFWIWNDLNRFADTGDVEGCRRVINGGANGLDFVIGYYKRAVEALGLERLGLA